jgi:hypothetical protein
VDTSFWVAVGLTYLEFLEEREVCLLLLLSFFCGLQLMAVLFGGLELSCSVERLIVL